MITSSNFYFSDAHIINTTGKSHRKHVHLNFRLCK